MSAPSTQPLPFRLVLTAFVVLCLVLALVAGYYENAYTALQKKIEAKKIIPTQQTQPLRP
jgi:multisubunit Na+/H+ antiporter MnhC subunit